MSAVTAIIAKSLGRGVEVGEFAEVPVHLAFGHDVSAPIGVRTFNELGTPIWDPERVVIIFDHFVPPSAPAAANEQQMLRQWVKQQGIKNFYDGDNGVCHQILIEKQLVKPGEILVGADSHTCSSGAVGCLGIGVGSTELAAAMATGRVWMKVPETIKVRLQGKLRAPASAKDAALVLLGMLREHPVDYRVIEFSGDGTLTLPERITMANLMSEGGAKSALFTDDFPSHLTYDDRGVVLNLMLDLDSVTPMLAMPYSPDNVIAVDRLTDTVAVQQAYIGSCTNGRLEDLSIAAGILQGKRVHPGTRLIVAPASSSVLIQAIEQGIITSLLSAGAILAPAACGACFGGHIGLLGDGEVCISSTNRNFKGRMGSGSSQVYLASPATVAVSALRGVISDPRKEC
ncbi:MAG: 3-isopropylmalate dehydratase large subunit [Desulfarculales bacterium]|jgi:3-isopropylmalate dehydratase large subunit|nr:3-isopropylmalate dehydratase large subunit [Desulfarculales bacterium]